MFTWIDMSDLANYFYAHVLNVSVMPTCNASTFDVERWCTTKMLPPNFATQQDHPALGGPV